MNNKFKNKGNNFSAQDKKNIKSLVDKRNDYSGTIIIFNGHDGSKRKINTSDIFFQRRNGQRLRISEIIQKINGLRHDFHAKDYNIL